MTLYEYLMLSDEKQWDVLWDKGTFLENFKSIDCSYSLYAIDKFFVEVELCPLKDYIIGKSIFKEGQKLDKYFPEIRIP